MPRDHLARILTAFPIIHHACRRRQVADASGRGRVSSHQATILAQLERGTGVTVTELAQRMGVTLPTMSLLVDRLVRGGLIHRERDPDDRRRASLRLTALGERVRASQSMLDPDRVRSMLALLTADERAAGIAGLSVLARAARLLGSPAERPTTAPQGFPR